MHATCPPHLILLDFILPIKFGEVLQVTTTSTQHKYLNLLLLQWTMDNTIIATNLRNTIKYYAPFS